MYVYILLCMKVESKCSGLSVLLTGSDWPTREILSLLKTSFKIFKPSPKAQQWLITALYTWDPLRRMKSRRTRISFTLLSHKDFQCKSEIVRLTKLSETIVSLEISFNWPKSHYCQIWYTNFLIDLSNSINISSIVSIPCNKMITFTWKKLFVFYFVQN